MTDNYEMDNFKSVWDRVTNSSNGDSKEKEDIKQLREFMDDEVSDMTEYTRLAACCKGPTARLLCEMASDERGHLKKLQTIHFILTGDTYAPEIHKKDYTSVLDALRGQYAGELEGAAMYKKAWGQTENHRLSELYSQFSDDELRHSRIIEGIISDIMG